MNSGMLHLVEFDQPGQAIRDNAQAFDLVPKNLDIYVRDMPTQVAALKAAGQTFRNENYSEVTAPDGTVFRELHMPSHDAINIVLLEVLGKELPFTPQGFAGVGPLICIIADAKTERAFWADVMELEILADNILEGPEIEKMIGLPPGSALDVSIWGAEGESMGQMEIINYRGTKGSNLFPTAVPKQRGILYVTYEVNDLTAFTKKLKTDGREWTDLGHRSTLTGAGHYIRIQSPAGLNIELFEPKQ
jgi:catechol 2,3-dioxygenase-like lactoylglutathione lyase family enzyme